MIKKTGIDELVVGARICGMKKTHGEASFFENNLLIRDEEDIRRLRSSGCSVVYVDIEPPGGGPLPVAVAETPAEGPKEADIAELVTNMGEFTGPVAESPSKAVEPERPENKPDGEDPAGFDEEVGQALGVRAEAENVIGDLFRDARMGKSIDKAMVRETVGGIIDSVFRNRDAITSLARLKSYDHYTFTHSVNVCILSTALGRWLELGKEDMFILGSGAILHDIGKMLIEEDLLNKRGGYTEEEFKSMQRHAVLGADFLSGTSAVEDRSIQVIARHHERYDGSGYPGGLSGEEVPLYARICAVADIYDAMTSDRVYRRRMIPGEVLKLMYLKRDSYFGPGLLEKFIQCIGIYPIGSLVELNTGEVALIRSVNRTDLLKPQVVIVLDKDKKPFSGPVVVDLQKEKKRRITCAADPDHHTVNFDEFLL